MARTVPASGAPQAAARHTRRAMPVVRRASLPFALACACLCAWLAPPAGAQAPPPADPAPVLSEVSLVPRVVAPRTATTLRFTLSEPARLAGVVERRLRGVRTRGGRCLKPRRGRRGGRCERRVRSGTLAVPSAAAGANRARLALRGLARGAYTLRLTPTDAAGQAGPQRAVRFSVDL
jgi:hypothetical protein